MRTTFITVAPNGAYKQSSDHPAIPLSAGALAQEAKQCLDAGASMIHLHVRASTGEHLLQAQAYAEATRAIRQAVGDALVVQVTTEAAKRYAPPAQMQVVRDLRPEAASFAIAELMPDARAEAEAAEFFAWVHREAIMAQYILYSPSDVLRFQDLRQRGVLPPGRSAVLFVLGRYAAAQQSDPRDLLPFLSPLPDESLQWSVCAFGATENACVLTAAALGGHARVGFENNLFLANGTLAPHNATLVSQVREGLSLMGRQVGTASQMRAWFGSGPKA